MTHTPTFDGQFHTDGSFDAVGGATINAALEAFMTADPPGTPYELRRSPAQRRADALVAVAQAALASDEASDVAGIRPHVVVRVNWADLTGSGGVRPPEIDGAGTVGLSTVRRLLGDSSIARLVMAGASQPLEIGAATRVWPAAMRRVITERDRGCRFDPCDRPARWCEIDHVIPGV